MASPAAPAPDINQFPKAMQKYIKPLLDYIKATHVEDAKVTLIVNPSGNPPNPEVEFLRADSGLTLNIKLYVTGC